MNDFEIKTVEFNVTEREIYVRTKGGYFFVLGFKREFYFDLILKVALIQHSSNNSLGLKEMEEILNTCKEKYDALPKDRRAEYGMLKLSSIENYWTSHFANVDRKYTIIKKKIPETITDEQITRNLLRNNLFSYEASKERIRYSIASQKAKIVPPEDVFKGAIQVSVSESYIGTKKAELIPIVVDLDDGFAEEDIEVELNDKRVPLPPEIEAVRQQLFKERELAIRKGQEYPWPGVTFGIESFTEQRMPLTEKGKLYFTLKPTDYFVFKAIQDNLDKKILRDNFGRPQSPRERYLSELNPFVPVPEMAQSISATVVLLCQDRGKQVALLAQRSQRVATGKDVFVLSVNETPKRKPTSLELKFLEDVPRERLEPDTNGVPNPFFNALARGTVEEIGIELPKSAFKILTFGLEPKRYMYVLIGIAETELTTDHLKQAFNTAKDVSLEYAGFHFVDFVPESIYDFMRDKEWGSEAEMGLYHALIHKYGRSRVQKVFSSYPLPRIL